ncbi:MAG: hypothetical protein HYY56_07365, partial [Candidatus Omnitrophica bacterium]|nr:hypothetical protein [Candidatus Omnitrophota bacterium]
MGVFDIYSKRKQVQEKAGKPDVYKYDEIPESLRIQVIHIWRTAIGNTMRGNYINELPNNIWIAIHDILCRELGLLSLSNLGGSPQEKCHTFLLRESNIDYVLSLIEVSFRLIQKAYSSDYYRMQAEVTQDPNDAIDELNTRFKEHGVGYQYVNGIIIRMDSQYVHAEAVRPAISLLQEAGFEGASEEFLNAHKHYRKGRNKEAIAEALKAFESTMKSICSFMKWGVPENATAKPLIDACFSNGLIPKPLESHFNSLKTTLESGLPTASNRLARHGQGEKKVTVPDHIAAYALHLAATNIVFLV